MAGLRCPSRTSSCHWQSVLTLPPPPPPLLPDACAPHTGKKRNKANVVTFSNKHNRKWQYPNLQHKKVYWAEGQRWVKLRICTKAIKTIEKKGLDAMAKEAGIDLWKLPFEDARPERLAYLEANKGVVPVVSPWGGRRGRGAVEAQRQGQGQGHDPRAGGSGWGGGGAEQALCHSRCACGGAAEHARRVQAATAAGRAIA